MALDMTTLTIMRILPREVREDRKCLTLVLRFDTVGLTFLVFQVDPAVFHMSEGNEEKTSYSDIGGLTEQIRELREVIELPLTNPELFVRVGIKPPKGVLLYGPPGKANITNIKICCINIYLKYFVLFSSQVQERLFLQRLLPAT